jgi:acyl carrier protein
MTRTEIFNGLLAIFKENPISGNLPAVDEECRLGTDIPIDSLGRIELLFEIEQRFSISVSDDEAKQLVKVKDIVDLVEGKVKSAG